MNAVYDGFISRHMNRKLSDPVARMLTGTRVTPNQATCGATGIAVFSFVSLVNGSLARLKGMTSVFGGFLDSVLDRYADAMIVLGMILWSRSRESYPGIWLVGFPAMIGILSVSYTRARIDPEHRLLFDKRLASIASRYKALLDDAGMCYVWASCRS